MSMATLRIISVKSLLTLVILSTLMFVRFVLQHQTSDMSEKDEYFGLFPDNIAIDELGDDCLGGNEYMWEKGKLKEWV